MEYRIIKKGIFENNIITYHINIAENLHNRVRVI